MPHESRLMEALEHVIINGWDHPVLVKLITGAEIDEEIGEHWVIYWFIGWLILV